MLHVVNSLEDPFCRLVRDDPVRPELPLDFRINDAGKMFIMLDEQGLPLAVTCMRICDQVPTTVDDLAVHEHPGVAAFYTIWSYGSGAAGRLIIEAKRWIEQHLEGICEFVTLSPPTEMARKFHLRNGAEVLRDNGSTVNYQYR